MPLNFVYRSKEVFSNMEINYKNDVLFKYALSNETDKDCQFLLKLIINEIIGIEYQYLHIINPDIIPEKLL